MLSAHVTLPLDLTASNMAAKVPAITSHIFKMKMLATKETK
jgi:hypothetical protein